uniref:tail fiber assembly protein n=1 Tax=Citrobacter freundii TaxID=546 RepID=UPI001E384C2D
MTYKIYFSAAPVGFFSESDFEALNNAGSWPSDAVEVSQSQRIEFTGLPPAGKVLGSVAGLPAWVDLPLPTKEESEALAAAQKLQLRSVADEEIEWRQDAVDVGIATDDEAAALAEWKKYRVLLMRVDTTDPVWPTPPATQAS